MLKVIGTTQRTAGLFLIGNNLNMGSLNDLAEMASQQDIIVDRVEFTAGDSTDEGFESFVDDSMAGTVFPSFPALISHFNTVLRAARNLRSYFNIAAGNFINYENLEGWSSAVVVFDRGGYSAGYDYGHD